MHRVPFRPAIRALTALIPFVILSLVGSAAAAARDVLVSARDAWTPTSMEFHAGQRFHVEADGGAKFWRLTLAEAVLWSRVNPPIGPEGSYLWPDEYARRGPSAPVKQFPVPAGEQGPAPAFGLIGRIGEDGPPFYLGRSYDGVADRAGALWLGINDHTLQDNRGAFHAHILLDTAPVGSPAAADTSSSQDRDSLRSLRSPARTVPARSPAVTRPIITPSPGGRPVPGARVLLLYVDGLRPDVVRELARQGFLPTLQRVFLDGGLDCTQAFTTFPSNTLIANGALFTGLFPDRTGIKSQNQFERTTLQARGQVSEWIPDWLLRRTASPVKISDLLDKFAPENTHHFLRQRGVPTLGSRLKTAFRYTVLPIAPLNPPPQWLHHGLNAVDNPFAAAVRIPSMLDRVNTRYVVEELLEDPDARVIAAWFPMVDKVCHFSGRGQFGAARRDLVRFDGFLARILRRLRELGRDQSTYLILVSDHGHLGGEQAVNRRCNLASALFHRRLGCNVKVVGQEWTHPGNDPDRFVFLDHQGAGQAAIFLPKAAYHTGPWQRNTLEELQHYDVGPNRGAVNLLEVLAQFQGPEWDSGALKPVDLVLVPLDARRVLVYRSAEQRAVIHISDREDGVELYRYDASGGDPLGYLGDQTVRQAVGDAAAWMEQPHTAEEWLQATAATDYPDAVVGMAKFFGWKPPMDDLAAVRTPDLVVTASRGWSFRSDGEYGTDHGSPLRESMTITLMLAGPNVRHGVLREPHRIIDVLPTILEMAGWPYDPAELDGRALTGIYEE